LRKANSHPQLGGKSLGGLDNGRLLKGQSFDQDPLQGPLPNPHVGLYEWLTHLI
jgi:hypothetical protein